MIPVQGDEKVSSSSGQHDILGFNDTSPNDPGTTSSQGEFDFIKSDKTPIPISDSDIIGFGDVSASDPVPTSSQTAFDFIESDKNLIPSTGSDTIEQTGNMFKNLEIKKTEPTDILNGKNHQQVHEPNDPMLSFFWRRRN